MRWSLVLFTLYSVATILAAPVKPPTSGNPAPTSHPPRVTKPNRSRSHSPQRHGGRSSPHPSPQHPHSGNAASTSHPPRVTKPNRSRSSSPQHHGVGSSPHPSPKHPPSGNAASTSRPLSITIPNSPRPSSPNHNGGGRSSTSSPLTPLPPSPGPSSLSLAHGTATPSDTLAAKLRTWTRDPNHPKVKKAIQKSETYSKRAEHSPWVLERPDKARPEHWVKRPQTKDGSRDPNADHFAQQPGGRKKTAKGKLEAKPYQADHVFEHQMLHAGLELSGTSFKNLKQEHQTAIRQILNNKYNMQFVEHEINNRKGLRVKMAMEHTMSEDDRRKNGLHKKWKNVEGDTGYMKETAGIAAHTAKELDDYLVQNKLIKERVMHPLLETTYRRAGIIKHDEGIVPLPPPTLQSAPSTPASPQTPPPQQPQTDAAGNPVQGAASPSTGMTRSAGSPSTTPPRAKRERKGP